MAEGTRSQELERRVMALMQEFEARQENLRKEAEQRNQKAMDEIKALLAGLSLQNMELASGKGSDGSASNQNVSSHKIRQSWGNSTKLEFPRFSGEGLEGWLLRVDYFFEVANVAADDRVKMAALHLEGKALQWHQGFIKVRGSIAYLDWGAYVGAITARFGSNAFEDPLADLRNLKQVSSLQDYLDAFDEIYPKAGIREDQALSFFLSGLVDELQMPKKQAYVMQLITEENEEDEENEDKGVEGEMASDMQLSLNAMWGTQGTQIMRIKGECGKRILHVLVDTGSTHNFLSTKMASKLKCELQKAAGISVEVANGQQLQCEGFCKNFTWSMQGLEFHAEVYVLALDNYDLILGAQWLSTLGEILWNFQTMMMTFKRESMLCVLQGETKKKLSKELNSLMTCLNDDGLFHVEDVKLLPICIQ
ncbi:hypothetical protein GH714_017567 [Hevea brasiliensis]|uniref:Retrotransposon gag domain-containing protein n=1 Tax=Hevea brasiliensis TaxID=3981 RepID=A0A6A6K6B6_HEVBR|nr:hypothetical protein GH714_017567 [Hevea brasiliensis]